MKFKDLFASDKVMHFLVCFFLTVVFSAIFCCAQAHIAIGALIAVGIGLGKELYDVFTGGYFDIWDFCYDIIGAFSCAFLLCILEDVSFTYMLP